MDRRRQRLFSLVSLAIFSLLIFGYLWWGKFHYAHDRLLLVTYVSILALVLVNHLYHRDGARRLGFRADNMRQAAKWYGGATLLVMLGLTGLGYWTGELRLDRWSDLYGYFLWAGLQQHLLQNFLRLRSREVLGGRPGWAAVMAAVLFALYHLPNVPLVAVSFVGALGWCLLFARIPNLPWAWLSQAVLSGCLVLFFKHGPLNQLQVGKPGHRYDYYGTGVMVAGGHDGHGAPFVATLPGPDRGVPAKVRVYTPEGNVQAEWTAFPELGFSGHLAVGDVGFEPGDEIVVSPGPGRNNPPLIAVYTPFGRRLSQFKAPFKRHGYGAWVGVGCGRIYSTPGAGPGRADQLLELSGRGALLAERVIRLDLENSFRAIGLCETLPRTSRTAASRLVAWGSPISTNPSRVFVFGDEGTPLASFDPLSITFGLNLTPLRLKSGELGIAIAPGPLKGYPPLVCCLEISGRIVSQFSAFDDREAHGSNIGAVDTDGDGCDEIILGEGIGPGRPETVRILRQDGALLYSWRLPRTSRPGTD